MKNQTMVYRSHPRTVVATMLAVLCLIGCGGGNTESAASAGVTISSETIGNSPIVQPIADPSGQNTLPDNALATGTFLLDEYIDFLDPEFIGVIEVKANPVNKRRLIDGSRPRRLADGRVLYRRACGQFVYQFMIADTSLRSSAVSPCGSEVTSINAGRATFEFAQLAPDGNTIAIDTRYYDAALRQYRFHTLVFDTRSFVLLANWQHTWTPLYLPSGQLLLSATDGFYILDETFNNIARFGDLDGSVEHPALNPSQNLIAFEHNQQIWSMNVDGSDPRALIIGGSRLKYPAWSPDGKPAIAYLLNPNGDIFEEGIFITNYETGEGAVIDLAPQLSGINTVNGPVSWY